MVGRVLTSNGITRCGSYAVSGWTGSVCNRG